jgi:hypothetical protein
MTILPMSIFEKTRWFILDPLICFLFPQTKEEIEREIIEREYFMERMEKKGFHFNRKKDGEDLGRP